MHATDMTQGPPLKLIWGFALPMMLGNVFQQLYTIVDAAFMGRFAGIDALAAMGTADWLCWMIMGIVTGYTQGFSILISQRFGSGDRASLRRTIGLSVSLTVVLSLALVAFSQAIIRPVMGLLRTPAEIQPYAVTYLRILFIALPIYSAYNVQASMLRAVGDAKTPLIAMVIASVTNIALDALFMIVFRWGVAGAAIATAIAQATSGLYCALVIRKMEVLRFGWQDLRWEKQTAGRLIQLGTPAAAQNLVIGVGGMAVQRVINGFGSLFIAGFTVTNKLYGLMEMAATSYGGAIAAYTGQNYGAGRMDRIRRGTRTGVKLALATSFSIALALFVFGRTVLSLFVDPAEIMREQVLDVAQQYLNVMLGGLFILYLLYVYRSALQGMGDTLTPMVSGMAELAMRISAALILPALVGQSGIYFAEPAAWLGAELLLMFTYYYKIKRLPYREGT